MLNLRTLRRAVLLIGAACFLAACGGDESTPAPPATTALPPATDAPQAAAVRTLPPTWTPAPTLTPVGPRPTGVVTLDAPTRTPVILPTLTPTLPPPTATPPGPVIVLDAAALTDALAGVMQGGVGGYFGAVPTVTIAGGRLRVHVPLWTTPGDPNTERPIVVELAVGTVGGRVAVEVWRVYAEDSGTDYVSDLTPDIADEVERQLHRLLVTAVGEGRPFSVLAVEPGDGQVTFHTQAAPADQAQ